MVKNVNLEFVLKSTIELNATDKMVPSLIIEQMTQKQREISDFKLYFDNSCYFSFILHIFIFLLIVIVTTIIQYNESELAFFSIKCIIKR